MSFVLWEILIPLIVAFLLGLLFGWLMWGWRRTKITYTEWETMRQKAGRSSAVEVEAELAEAQADRDRLQAELDKLAEADVDADAEVGAGVLGLSGAAAIASGDEADAATTADAETATADTDTTADEADEPNVDADRAVEGERHPYGEGSHAPFSDDNKSQPAGYSIKGNADSMLYHRPDSRSYKVTGAEVWFDTGERAEAAGFTLANTHPADT